MLRKEESVREIAGPTRQERFRGCLLCGAVGDALGAPIEFLNSAQIRHRFGTMGIRDYAPAYGRLGAFTDDTQMTLFTAEGMLRSWVYVRQGGDEKTWLDFMHDSYQQWLRTQDPSVKKPKGSEPGWLASHQELFTERAPGSTCLSALRGYLPGRALNNSKGCGGVMRAAPVGLWLTHQTDNVAQIFEAGLEMAAITHGHPSGYLSAGVFTVLIALLSRGQNLRNALPLAKAELAKHKGQKETADALQEAEQMLKVPDLEAQAGIEKLGGAWIAEEALAIAVYCALRAEGFEEGVAMAVNHGGDSNSTGSMVGNLLGCIHGVREIPLAGWSRWNCAT